MTALRDLWAGRLPLRDILWTWAVYYGGLLNAGCTLISMWLWLVWSTGPVAVVALVIHFLPVPYNVVFAIGAWRAAGRPEHSPRIRVLARGFAVALFALFLAI